MLSPVTCGCHKVPERSFYESSHRMKTGPLLDSKTITVHRNGDGYFVGRKIVVNPRLSTLDILLDYLTSVRAGAGQAAQFGAVRKLYTVEGHRVRRLEQVEAGGRYVAAGNESFKHLSYSEITARKPQTKVNEQIQPVVHSRIQASSRWGKTKDGTCTIHVFTNGEVLVSPVKIRIPKYTLKSWDNVLAMVTEKVCLRSGAVHRLCTMDGRPLSGPAQLRNQQYYVAMGAERFKALPYDQRLHIRPFHSKHSSQGCGRQSKALNLAHVCLPEEFENTPSGQLGAAERQMTGGSSVLGASVFTAQNRRSELVGAAEVQEDGWLSTGPPIDQLSVPGAESEPAPSGPSSSKGPIWTPQADGSTLSSGKTTEPHCSMPYCSQGNVAPVSDSRGIRTEKPSALRPLQRILNHRQHPPVHFYCHLQKPQEQK
ncbi:doublecortin domain-containing protein 2 [Eucyclogobius newberryi]|uniref:doublecortin domain-containing protein 2 n=1 Tax=Eucyclogobius newberryi TaxID=166745 RepID=UPI003B5AFB8A